jgi:CBS domain-containing protein
MLTFMPDRIQQLRRCCRGTTTPEYAILALAILTVIIFAVGTIGELSSCAIQDVGDSFDGAQRPTATPVGPGRGGASFGRIVNYLSSWAVWTTAFNSTVIVIALAWLALRLRQPRSAPPPRPLGGQLSDDSLTWAVAKRQKIARRLYHHTDTLLKGDIEVRHLMTECPFSVGPNATVRHACEIMHGQNLDYLLVCGPDGSLLGLVSRYFLMRSDKKRVADAMLPNPLYVTPESMLSSTVTQMLNEGVSCVAVVEGGRGIGMVTTTDIKLTFQAALQVLAKTTMENTREAQPAMAVSPP